VKGMPRTNLAGTIGLGTLRLFFHNEPEKVL
jgi:hypothetical protein